MKLNPAVAQSGTAARAARLALDDRLGCLHQEGLVLRDALFDDREPLPPDVQLAHGDQRRVDALQARLQLRVRHDARDGGAQRQHDRDPLRVVKGAQRRRHGRGGEHEQLQQVEEPRQPRGASLEVSALPAPAHTRSGHRPTQGNMQTANLNGMGGGAYSSTRRSR
eukprot:98560-Rhodomonas_salina.1